MKIESQHVLLHRSNAEIYTYLYNLENIIHLLPQDKISDWQATPDYCSFKVQQAATIDLELVKGSDSTLIQMKSGKKSPFPFTLDLHIQAEGAASCNGYLVFDGKVNPFLKLMVEKPLTNLFNYMADRLREIKG